MLTFKELINQNIITEEIHKELKAILNEPESERGERPAVYAHQKKLNRFTAKFKQLVANNEETGLEEEDGKPVKPKKGSSRAVFFPNKPKQIHIDGKPVEQYTAVKIAFPGKLDKYTGEPKLLGEYQNEAESDYYTRNNHSILSEDSEHPGHYHTNEDGVTAPVFSTHPDDHWLEMAKTNKMTKAKFRSLTKHPSHPKGLDFDKFTDTLKKDHADAHGQPYYSGTTDEEMDHIRQHPLYEKTQDFIYNTDNHPGDLRLPNYGVWTHPVTGKEHALIIDGGFNGANAKRYVDAQRKEAEMKRRQNRW